MVNFDAVVPARKKIEQWFSKSAYSDEGHSSQVNRRGRGHEISFSSCAEFSARTLLPSFDQLITSQHVFWRKLEEW